MALFEVCFAFEVEIKKFIESTPFENKIVLHFCDGVSTLDDGNGQ